MDPFIGQIQAFGFNFAPRGWAKCDGQLLPISQYSALFSLLGTTYGGDGRTTFGLPDLRGRLPIHAGNGPGLSSYREGQKGGSETVTLTTANLPAHSHQAMLGAAETVTVKDKEKKEEKPEKEVLTAVAAPSAAGATGNTGGGQAFSNLSPYLSINFCIALEGIFPSRS